MNAAISTIMLKLRLTSYVNDELSVIKGYRQLGINPQPPAIDSASIVFKAENLEQFRVTKVTAKS